MRETWTFGSAGQLIFGRNAVKQLGDVADRLKVRRVLIVTDPVLMRTGLVEQVRGPLKDRGVTVETFDGGEPEPSIRAVDACVAQAKKFGPDALIGVGGGSNMDLAKSAATILTHGGVPKDYMGEERVPGPIMPMIAVATTAGTGSEVSAGAVLTDTENQIKFGMMSRHLRPMVAVVDPLLTLSCPPKVTADSGIDALTHAIEAYTAVDNAEFPLPSGEQSNYQGRNPLGDMFAEKAIALIGTNLRRAVADGKDVAAREGMALGATLAGLAFSNVGVALVHALEYPIGGAVHCSHGAGNGLLLPYVMRFNMPMRRKELANIARLLGEETAGLNEEQTTELAITAVERLRKDIGIPSRLREIGVKEDQLPMFAEKALGIKRILRVNPRTVNIENLVEILKQAF